MEPNRAGDVPPDSTMKSFIRDQAAAARVLREEKLGEDRDAAVDRRENACYLAMRYYDTFSAGQTPSVETIIRTARQFERYLLES